ncbi:3-beta hydroxysteroid dehydrogenase/isomerase family protein [Winogradskyella psychrotolerans RS-3]|uniref:3-beta hydroxysteroid dehydrogenase/isomerase family protein n=1 Tax=Winogradskyella psychrotolerans RS-3 TaxID=641526 RepID=S7VSR9_9FLAO|nr:NAD-dependent epimerase/dehydratase family protein [Winogradskyella psychrotolerans]EPR73280.1 3-beta hydroxysteroid dehydrogenase/isomerase family protein [Winogradskyella psychrotolerans RS-3]
MILVTGGTGLVGSHLLFQLLKSDEPIRAIYRREKTLARVKNVFSYFSNDAETLFNKIEWVEADINDIPKLEAAFKGITHVYHCAAFVSFEPDKYNDLRKINIKGTANIVNLSISHQVKKLCYVSTIAAIGHHSNPEKLIDEQTDWSPEDDNSVYAITKYGAELEVWRGTQEGLDAVIVNPGIILGAGYWNGGGSGNLFKRIYKGMPYYTTGVTGYIDVWDVVKAMEQLMHSTIKNEGFILVTENLSFQTFLTKTAKKLEVKPPTKEAKPWLLGIAWRLDWLQHLLFGKRRSLSKQTAKSALSVTNYDASKIINSLNFEFKPIDKSIEEVSKLFLKDY